MVLHALCMTIGYDTEDEEIFFRKILRTAKEDYFV